MSDLRENQNRIGQEKEEQSVDFKALVYVLLSKWYLFLACVVFALAIGWVYKHFKTPQFQVDGTVLIKDSRSMLDPTSIMTGVNYSNMQNIDNELAILKSYTLSEKVVKKMDLEVTYYNIGRIRTAEAYKTSPFTVEFDKQIPQAVGLLYNIVINGDKVNLLAESDYHRQYDYVNEHFIVNEPEKIRIS